TLADRKPAAVQNDVVEESIFRIDIECGSHGIYVCRIVAFDLLSNAGPILDVQPFHHDVFANSHGRTNADAEDLRHITKQRGYSPAANEYISLLSQPEDFFGSEARQLSLVDLPSLQESGGTPQIPLKSDFLDA